MKKSNDSSKLARCGNYALEIRRAPDQDAVNMHRLLLIILIISNASAGIEVATDYEDAWAESGGPTIAADLQSGLADGGDDPDEEAACDHCCHGAAHFAGAVASNITLPYVRAASAIVVADTPYYFTSLSPPTPPPNA